MGGLTKAGQAVNQYRESHHAVARLVAIGATHEHIRRITGLTFKRISTLHNDPAFKELVTIYREDVEKKWNKNVDAYMDLGMGNMIRTEAMISDQLDKADEEDKDLPLLTLNRLSQDRADRFGYPKTSQVEHKHDFAALMDRAIERSGKAKEVKLIEAIAVEVSDKAEAFGTTSPFEPSLPSGPVVKTAPQPSKSPARTSFVDILSTKRRRVA